MNNNVVNKIRETYKVDNQKLLRLSNLNFLLELGYPEKFLSKIDEEIIINSFPISFPFKDINLYNKNYLDLGCGVGLDCYYAKSNSAKIVLGVDLSYSLLNNKLNFIKLVCDINKSLPFKEQHFFEIINLNGSFNQIIKKFSLLNNLYKILKDDGLIIINDLLWIGSKKEFQYYKNDENAWIFNIGGCLTENSIWNIEARTFLKIALFDKFEKEYPVQKYRLILKK